MALNFTVSYTFSPSTTISSSQVNTNTSDVAAVFQGLEAETKTLAKLKVDIDPTLALEVATKQYVDHYAAYRRPVLQFASITTVAVEAGLDGTSGDIPIQFPDGSMRIETSTTRTTFNITRNAVLVTSGAQSGLTGATSEAANTWYALYAVKVTDSSTLWVTVGSTVLPLQANYATLNTAYGTNGWVYLGLIRNGNGLSGNSDIIEFWQTGNMTMFNNAFTGTNAGSSMPGFQIATTTAAGSLSWSYSAGTSGAVLPNNVGAVTYCGAVGALAAQFIHLEDNANNGRRLVLPTSAAANILLSVDLPAGTNRGAQMVLTGGTATMDLAVTRFWDSALGIGSNPLL